MFDISKIKLENFKSFRGEHSFEFPKEPGLYYLTGDNKREPRLGKNGCGKSTLLDAIYWCLYGRTTRGLKASDVVTWGEKAARVAATLCVGGTHFVLQRTQNPNSLTLNGEPVDQPAVEAHLRLSPTAFTYAVQMPQFGEPFFGLAPAAKMQLFSDIMGLEYWLDKSREAATLASEITNQKIQEEKALARSQGQLDQISSDMAASRERHKSFADNQAVVIKNLQAKRKEAEHQLKRLAKMIEEDKNAILKFDQKLAKLRQRLARHGEKSVCAVCKQPLPTKESDEIRSDIGCIETNRRDFDRELQRRAREYEAKKQEISSIQNMEERERKQENPYAEMVRVAERQFNKLCQRIGESKNVIEQLDNDCAAVNFWVTGFKRVRLFIIESTLRHMAIEVNNNLANVGMLDWRIEFDVERENKAGGVTKGFVVMVYPPGHEKPVRLEAWSGGEYRRLAMAGDLGLANLIMERAGLISNIEFYDEFSLHLSDEGVSDILELLHNRAHTEQRCIWVVDHRIIEYDGFAGILTIEKSDIGSSFCYRKGG